MKLKNSSKKRDENMSHRPEGFRQRAMIIALLMAITGLFFLGAVLHFTGWLKIF